MLKYLKAAQIVIAIAAFAVQTAEDVSEALTGEQKKAAAIADVQAKVPGLLTEAGVSVPAWFSSFLLTPANLGYVIDAMVAAANAAGHFMKGDATTAQ